MIRSFIILATTSLLISAASCEAVQKSDTMTFDKALSQASSEWMKLDGVIGVAESESDGKRVIMVLVSPEYAEEVEIPDTFHNYPVITSSSGPIHTQDDSE